MIELLIVIVVLGILAAVVIFALGGITGKSALASCQADGATVSTSLAAFYVQNSGDQAAVTGIAGTNGATDTPPTVSTTTYAPSVIQNWLTTASTTTGSPYIQSWPSNQPHYSYQIGWVITTPYATGTHPQALWTAELEIVTGDTWATGNALTANSTYNGNITNANLALATGTGSTPALYPYVGAASCANVS